MPDLGAIDWAKWWQALLWVLLYVVLATGSAVHAVLNKRDVRAALGWVVVIWVAPLVGSIAYWIFGINLINRRAVALFQHEQEPDRDAVVPRLQRGQTAHPTAGALGLCRFIDGLVDQPLTLGNEVEPLFPGLAYREMLTAIESAQHSIALATYIFDLDAAGERFADALADAVHRGVEVRVLIDAIGSRYSRRSMIEHLRRKGVPVSPFLRAWHPLRFAYANLRNHRKILVVDGRVGFTGGMNIRVGHERDGDSGGITDIHFRIRGPVVAHLLEVFVDDWLFAAREQLQSDRWGPDLTPAGDMEARGIPDGPDRYLGMIHWTLLGALACAERQVRIVTPYFLPIDGIAMALQTAARRGVHVQILLPERNNLLLVGWASRGLWDTVLEGGCELWLTPPPFDHSKLMVVDDDWSLIGSANWDPRSLRLNFEINLEVRSRALNLRLQRAIESKLAVSRQVDLESHRQRPFGQRLLDSTVRLASPYL